MKKRNISIGVAIAIVALLFTGTGIALAGTDTENLTQVFFYQESTVEGTGLVMVDKDISTAPGDPSENLETNLHIHGCGDYEVDQIIQVLVGNYSTPDGTFIRNVSQTIDYCEDALMTFRPITIKSGSMTLIDEDTSIKLKEDLCIKNYRIGHQIGTAMRAKYTDADYIKKTIESNVTCVVPYLAEETAVRGYGLAKMDIRSTVRGASHVGAVVKDRDHPHITVLRVSEDYIGNFTIEKKMKVKMHYPIGVSRLKDWLSCPFGPTGDAEFHETVRDTFLYHVFNSACP